MVKSLVSLLSIICLSAFSNAQPQYKSRPDIIALTWDIQIHNKDLVLPGYIFIALYGSSTTGLGVQTAPYIYDVYGELIWSGFGLIGGISTSDFHPSSFNNLPNHLSLINSNVGAGYAHVHTEPSPKSTQETGSPREISTNSTFYPLASGLTALQTIYQPVAFDLTSYNITRGQGWLLDGVFQELDILTGRVIFEWRASEHVNPGDSYIQPTGTAGTTPLLAWDYFHINAVDKDAEGNCLISSRHFSSIFSISSRTGEILWTLNGKTPDRSNYTLENFTFSFQHNIRYLSTKGNSTIYSLFDNASNGDITLATGNQSQGYLISLNHFSKTATLVQNYSAPQPGGLLSGSQSNTQVLPNGNVFLGWGANPYISEYTEDGTAVYFANFSTGAGGASYRNYKANFTASPIDRPAVYAYSKNTTANTTVWTSWNGATEVRGWRFWGKEGEGGEWVVQGERGRTGFETNFTGGAGVRWVYSEALDERGRSLGKSGVEKTFVPGDELGEYCGEFQCPLL